MLSNPLRDFSRLLILVLVVVKDGKTSTCVPKQLRLLSNCSFQLPTNNNHQHHRTLSMIVPYALANRNDDAQANFITLFRHQKTSKAIIRLNLNLIQCTHRKRTFNWTSLESSSTLRGEFLRTSQIENNLMYLPSGRIFLKNLTALDCSTKTFYRTDDHQVFELDLKIESTLNDVCLHDQSCQPKTLYQCDRSKQRCACRQPFQNYSLQEQYPICLQTVQTMAQCLNEKIRCVEWCHVNRSAKICLCPQEYSKKVSEKNQTYCESQTGGKCNSFLHCPLNDQCLNGICQNPRDQSQPFDLLTLSIIITSFVLLFISILFGISLCLFRRQRWKTAYHHPSSPETQRELTAPTMSNYDNVTYDAFRQNVHLSSSDENDSSPVPTSDECAYEPKIIYLGGEQQLTAIFA